MSKKIYKHTVTVTVLSSSQTLDDLLPVGWTLADLQQEMDVGAAVGDWDSEDTEISPENVKDELKKVGNDGTFFDDLDNKE